MEELMVRRALKAARRSDVCLLVIDATDGLSEQEARLSTFANEAGRACVVVVNKWDLVANKDDRLYRSSRAYVESKLSDVAWAQCIYVSAKTGLKTQELFKAIDAAAEQHQRRVGTSVMNEVRGRVRVRVSVRGRVRVRVRFRDPTPNPTPSPNQVRFDGVGDETLHDDDLGPKATWLRLGLGLEP